MKRLIKCTDGLLVKESGDLEPVLLETMVAIGHQSDRQLIVELCALSNTMINYVYCDGNIPIAYNNVIMQLYSVLLGVDNGVWDPSDWSPQAASLHAIINYGQAVVSSETFAEFDAMFYPLLHSSKYSERFVSAVMMSVASANRTSDGSYFLMYVKDLIELARDETPRVREQALLSLTDGMRASFRHSLEPQYLEMTNHIFTGTLHLCEDGSLEGLALPLRRAAHDVRSHPDLLAARLARAAERLKLSDFDFDAGVGEGLPNAR